MTPTKALTTKAVPKVAVGETRRRRSHWPRSRSSTFVTTSHGWSRFASDAQIVIW